MKTNILVSFLIVVITLSVGCSAQEDNGKTSQQKQENTTTGQGTATQVPAVAPQAQKPEAQKSGAQKPRVPSFKQRPGCKVTEMGGMYHIEVYVRFFKGLTDGKKQEVVIKRAPFEARVALSKHLKVMPDQILKVIGLMPEGTPKFDEEGGVFRFKVEKKGCVVEKRPEPPKPVVPAAPVPEQKPAPVPEQKPAPVPEQKKETTGACNGAERSSTMVYMVKKSWSADGNSSQVAYVKTSASSGDMEIKSLNTPEDVEAIYNKAEKDITSKFDAKLKKLGKK